MSERRTDDRTAPRSFRATEDEWIAIGAAADAAGMTRSDYIRERVLTGTGFDGEAVYVRPNGGGIVSARVAGVNADGRRVFDDGGPPMVEGVDAEAVEDERHAGR